MAIPANSTRASVAHRTTNLVPHDLPKQYAIQSDGIHSIPASLGEGRHVFSIVEAVKKDDIVAVWRKPETLAAHEQQVTVFRIDIDLPTNWRVHDASKIRTADDMLIVFRTVAKDKSLIFRASEIEAIHKWVGPLRKGASASNLLSNASDANKEPAAMTSNVPAQNELSLFTPAGGEALTMSSQEIADLLGNRHDKVKQSIERLASRGVISHPPMGDDLSIDAQGKERITKVYRLDKRSSLIVVAQLSPEFTAKVVDRWQELEEAVKQPAKPAAREFPVPQTFAEALMLAANQAAQIEHQKVRIEEKNAQIEEMKEDVQALDRIAGADDLFGLREAVAMLQTSQNKFVAWLQQNGWAYRQTGTKRLLAYADKRKAGYATNKAEPYTKKDGSEGVGETLKFYPAGIIKLAKLLNVTLTEGDLHTIHSKKGDAA